MHLSQLKIRHVGVEADGSWCLEWDESTVAGVGGQGDCDGFAQGICIYISDLLVGSAGRGLHGVLGNVGE